MLKSIKHFRAFGTVLSVFSLFYVLILAPLILYSLTQVDEMGHRKVLATTSVNMARYASALPFEHELNLKLKPVSRKIKKVMLEVNLSSVFLKEGKAT